MANIIITDATAEPITIDEAKEHLRVDGTQEDFLIASLITAARQYCETWQNRAYLTQTREQWMDAFPPGVIYIQRPPLVAVTSIKYTTADGVENTLAESAYFVDNKTELGRIVPIDTWPLVKLRKINGVVIRYTCGGETVNQRTKMAMLLLIGHWYENREASVEKGSVDKEIAFALRSLLWLDRVITL